MPNYCDNRLVIEPKEAGIALLKKLIIMGEFDFNQIVAMPKSIEESECSLRGEVSYGIARYQQEQVVSKELKKVLDQYHIALEPLEEAINALKALQLYEEKVGVLLYQNELLYGARQWYEWSVKYWGVKWNATSTAYHDHEVYFETPWCDVSILIRTLSAMHPELDFHYYFYEPGFQYAGEAHYSKGMERSWVSYQEYELGYLAVRALFEE